MKKTFATQRCTAVRTCAIVTLGVILAAASQLPVSDAAYAEVMTALSCAVGSQGRSGAIALRAEDLNDYGCFCGAEMVNVAMAGEPVDAIDACCMHHNTCWYGLSLPNTHEREKTHTHTRARTHIHIQRKDTLYYCCVRDTNRYIHTDRQTERTRRRILTHTLLHQHSDLCCFV